VLSDVMTTRGMQGSMCVSVERCRWIYARSYSIIAKLVLCGLACHKGSILWRSEPSRVHDDVLDASPAP